MLVDPEARWVPAKTPLQSKSRNTPFLERELQGRVLMTLAGGDIVFEASEVGG